jgi:hypothetical protein
VPDETTAPVPDEVRSLSQAEGRLLAQMPLHAITSVRGEAGLRGTAAHGDRAVPRRGP